MEDINFTGIAAWIFGIIFGIAILIVAGLLALEITWRHFAIKEKKKLLKRWADKYEVKQ